MKMREQEKAKIRSTVMKIGIDIGSTTVKVVVLTEQNEICFSRYERHMSNVFEKVKELLEHLYEQFPDLEGHFCITGSGGLTLSQLLGIPFE